MADSEKERGSMLPDQSEEIKAREKGGEREELKQPQEDYPVKEVERDEKGDQEKDKSIKDIKAGREKLENDDKE